MHCGDPGEHQCCQNRIQMCIHTVMLPARKPDSLVNAPRDPGIGHPNRTDSQATYGPYGLQLGSVLRSVSLNFLNEFPRRGETCKLILPCSNTTRCNRQYRIIHSYIFNRRYLLCHPLALRRPLGVHQQWRYITNALVF